MQIPKKMLLPARVLNEDDDFLTLEVAKHEGVTFHLQQNEEGETVGGDRFVTLMFCRMSDALMEIWLPWEDQDA